MKNDRNASRYRKPPIKRTTESFRDDVDREVDNFRDHASEQYRHTQIRRDQDDVRGPKVSLYDIDYSISEFIKNKIKPTVPDNEYDIEVPVIYANHERWSSIQKLGYVRDVNDKMILPVIVFRRSNISVNEELRRNRVSPMEDVYYLSERRHSSRNPYDQFSILNEEKRPREYYVTSLPDYIIVEYELKFWCEYQKQINRLIELFMYWQGKAFGDKNYYKFVVTMDSFSIEDSVSAGQDRMVRASATMRTKAYLVQRDVTDEVLVRRALSPKKVVFGMETTRFRQIGSENIRDSDSTKYIFDPREDRYESDETNGYSDPASPGVYEAD